MVIKQEGTRCSAYIPALSLPACNKSADFNPTLTFLNLTKSSPEGIFYVFPKIP